MYVTWDAYWPQDHTQMHCDCSNIQRCWQEHTTGPSLPTIISSADWLSIDGSSVCQSGDTETCNLVLIAQTYQWTLITHQKLVQSELLYESKSRTENSGREFWVGSFKPADCHSASDDCLLFFTDVKANDTVSSWT